MNKIIVDGHLVDQVKVSTNQNGNLTAIGKIGVYNGKTRDGQQRESMFFDIVVFGRDAEILRDNTTKGSLVCVIGRLEEEKSVSQTNGQTYINKRIVCDNAMPCIKPVMQNQQAQQVPVQQVAPQQPAQFAQPVVAQPSYPQAVAPQPSYTQPVQQPGSPG